MKLLLLNCRHCNGQGAVLVDYHMAVKNRDPAESLVLSSTRAIELAAEDTGAAPEMQFTGFSMLIPREALLGPAGADLTTTVAANSMGTTARLPAARLDCSTTAGLCSERASQYRPPASTCRNMRG